MARRWNLAAWLDEVEPINEEQVRWALPFRTDVARAWRECPRPDWMMEWADAWGVSAVRLNYSACEIAFGWVHLARPGVVEPLREALTAAALATVDPRGDARADVARTVAAQKFAAILPGRAGARGSAWRSWEASATAIDTIRGAYVSAIYGLAQAIGGEDEPAARGPTTRALADEVRAVVRWSGGPSVLPPDKTRVAADAAMESGAVPLGFLGDGRPVPGRPVMLWGDAFSPAARTLLEELHFRACPWGYVWTPPIGPIALKALTRD
jgi:hypothetical protein